MDVARERFGGMRSLMVAALVVALSVPLGTMLARGIIAVAAMNALMQRGAGPPDMPTSGPPERQPK